MSGPGKSREKLAKHGLILTCYVDGRKRFRCLSLAANGSSPPAPIGAPSYRHPAGKA